MNSKVISVLLIMILSLICLSGCVSVQSSTSDSSQVSATEHDFFVEDDTLEENFTMVCEATGINIDDIKNFEQTENWANGSRYNFIYHQSSFVVYCNMDSTIDALQIASGTDIYKKGLAPLNVSDFLTTEEDRNSLMLKGEETIRGYLNHPDSSDFHAMDWAFGRSYNLYTVAGNVTAENSFGVEDDLAFSVVYYIEDNLTTTVYVGLGGQVLVNGLDKYPSPDRAQVEDTQKSNNLAETATGIILEDGQLGEYGKEHTIGNDVYINYYLSIGEYVVNNLSAPCKVFVIDDASNAPVLTLDLSENSSEKLQLEQDQHIELTMGAKIEAVPVE